jgi:hypothetical protein
MSITPREPPSAVNSDAGEPRGRQSSSTRLAYGSVRAVRAASMWVWRGLRRLAARTELVGSNDGTDGRREPHLGREPGTRFGIGERGGGADPEGERAALPGERRFAGPELPPRPDLEADETDAGLELRRPGREEAYVTSDEWQEVRR